MAVLPQYYSGNESYAKSANAFIGGMKEGQSLMERKQDMALNQQRADLQRWEFIAKLPLIEAQATLTRVNAAAAVKNATDITNWESQAAIESTTANKEFQDAIQYNAAYDIPASDGTPEGDAAQAEGGKYATQQTLDTRSQKLAALSAKYSYMKNLPQYQGFIDRVDKEAAASHLAAAQNLKLEELMNQAQARAAASRYVADTGVIKEGIKADAKAASADTYTASRERIAAITNDTKLTLQERGARIAQEKTGATISDLQTRAAEADQQAAEASAAGDEQAAAVHRAVASSYRDAVQKVSTYAGQPAREVPTKSPAVRSPAADGAVSAEQSAAVSLPRPTPAEAATAPETSHESPVKVTAWSQAKSLKPGTKYIGPDGVLYTRGQ